VGKRERVAQIIVTNVCHTCECSCTALVCVCVSIWCVLSEWEREVSWREKGKWERER